MKKWICKLIFLISPLIFIGFYVASIFGANSEDWQSMFIEKAENTLVQGNFSDSDREKAIVHIKDWLSGNRYSRISQFCQNLDSNNVYVIAKAAIKAPLLSDPNIPAAEDPKSYGQATLLALPFHGLWHVVQGNRGIVSHIKGTKGEFAWDFVIMHDGNQFSGDAKKNEAHYCWNTPISAPAEGVVAKVVQELDDHLPMMPNPPDVGNHVYIDHENGEVSLLYHLKKNSVTVAVGEHVARGQTVGLCGDTGISMFPHLHYELFKGTVGKHTKFNTRFFGYAAWRRGPNPENLHDGVHLQLAGIPRRLDYLMNAGELNK